MNRIKSLWNQRGEINLIDLDNEYYLVRFAIEDDYNNVLLGGPWVIYGSYLTVQPWNRSFSTVANHPIKIMVWVLFPGLPYRYYTKSLFRCIAGITGNVVRIDYNTEDGKRGRFARLAVVVDLDKPIVSGIIIDGQHQTVEYEGLPLICYACGKYEHTCEQYGGITSTDSGDMKGNQVSITEENPYGPWMQVANKKKRNNASRISANEETSKQKAGQNLGSRYTILEKLKDVECGHGEREYCGREGS
ncbi:uncharacterized protein LOC120196354 [Hibiscus syriacus]|uniref:uncharacterized protein LOC120196354 n=1 Tax=Hibiscus syriacus TaxID=106335 RepID=UPI0019217AD4|nr:uncharacterized protein LOC120196354 [Hibiscus syriacus]